jgi:nucleotide sugar dehydrogenase
VNGLPNDPSLPEANPVRNMHFPGAGVGGHCLPKDTWLLMHGFNSYAGIKNRYPSSILADARHLNDWMPVHMVELLELALSEKQKVIKNSIISVLGFAFLENSDDSRNTPTVVFLKELEKKGAKYRIHDPYVKDTEEGYIIESDIEAVLKGSDAVVIMTKHEEYKSISPERLQSLMRTKIIVDGRHLFDPLAFEASGFTFKGVGKGNIKKPSHN